MDMLHTYYVIRHIPTQKLMPARMSRSGGRGWSHWDPLDPDNAGFGNAPRLFDDKRAAENARTVWLQGAFVHHHSPPTSFWDDPGGTDLLVAEKRDRKPEDVEVVPVTLEVPLTRSP